MQHDDVIEIRRGSGPWSLVPVSLAFVAGCAQILRGPDHAVGRFAGTPAHAVAWAGIVFFGLGVVVGTWAIVTRKQVVLRADVAGLVDRTRLAPTRRFDWSGIASVTTRCVARRTVVCICLVDGRRTDLGFVEGPPGDVARRLEEARACWAAPGQPRGS